jgi:hypothetical protein
MEADNQKINCDNTKLLLENTNSMVSALMDYFMDQKKKEEK